MTEEIRVGGATVAFDDALAWASRYIENAEGTFSYPAYDAYPGADTDAVGAQDLLAPALLNAGHDPIQSYYSLESLLEEINTRLRDPAMTGTLAEANEETVKAIARLFGVLDGVKTPGVRLTKLSKVLHRKRPKLIPLYDPNIRRCYSDLGNRPPVNRINGRGCEELSLVWLPALQRDLSDQADKWDRIAAVATQPTISPLRALDMVGWWLGKPESS